ncbi:MAG: hypothetical protein N2Z65_00660 [Clostridiales bacterium]|nr:hypothetical protein [Clostridiales bacterium]
MQSDDLLVRYSSIVTNAEMYPERKIDATKEHQLNGNSFEQILQSKIGQQSGLVFSKHAESRMSQRDIKLSTEDIKKLTDAVSKAGQKGIRNTLVLMDQTAFVINVPGNTVITAINGQDLKENVFTQIDGAVII